MKRDPIIAACADSQNVVDQFVFAHRAAAIPALIGACVAWAVEHGGGDVVRESLRSAIKVSVEMEADLKKVAQ